MVYYCQNIDGRCGLEQGGKVDEANEGAVLEVLVGNHST